MSGRVVLEAKGIVVGYGDLPVIKGLDISVSAGEVVSLLGANGAGKTTTLLAIAGELELNAGSVSLLGEPCHGPLHMRARRGMSFVSEERSVFMELTCLENLRLGWGSVDDAVDLVPELRPLLSRRAGLLSGGEQQMLTLARALAGKPAVLLADELSLGLAPMMFGRLLGLVRSAADAAGVGVLLVEQHVRKAIEVCDRGYVLRRGEIALSGSSAELSARLDEIEASYLSAPVA
jgi:ABC-type branched-chain amino acid transport systems, ATPase component